MVKTNHNAKPIIHIGFKCNVCDREPIIGVRFNCSKCDYDICSSCDNNIRLGHILKESDIDNKLKYIVHIHPLTRYITPIDSPNNDTNNVNNNNNNTNVKQNKNNENIIHNPVPKVNNNNNNRPNTTNINKITENLIKIDMPKFPNNDDNKKQQNNKPQESNYSQNDNTNETIDTFVMSILSNIIFDKDDTCTIVAPMEIVGIIPRLNQRFAVICWVNSIIFDHSEDNNGKTTWTFKKLKFTKDNESKDIDITGKDGIIDTLYDTKNSKIPKKQKKA